MRRCVWIVLLSGVGLGCGTDEPATAPAPIPAPPPAVAKSMLAIDYPGAWVKYAPKGIKGAQPAKPIHDARTTAVPPGGTRTIVIAPKGTEDEIGEAWVAFCEALSDVLIESGAYAASREVVEGMHPLQRVRYNAAQRQGVVTVGLVRAGNSPEVIGELFPSSDTLARTAIMNAQQDQVFVVITIDEK